MRIKVLGEGEVAKTLRGHLAAFSHVAVVDVLQDFTVEIRQEAGPAATIDGVDGPLEAHVLQQLAEAVGHVLVKRQGGNQRDDTIIVGIPIEAEVKAERALFRALTGGMAKVKRGWWRRRLFAVLLALFLPSFAQAQNVFLLKCHDGTTSFWCSDSVNQALRVNCVIGCGASSFLDNAAF